MTAIDPYWMRDKVGPEADNDPVEVIRAANVADELTGKNKPPRSINTLDEDDAFDSIRRFQNSRNLKADGVVNPKGPTAQRMAAEKHEAAERARPAAYTSVLGRGARAPLWGSVGRGGQNLVRDVKVAKSALALIGQKVSASLPPPDSNHDDAGGQAVSDGLRNFQKQHGLKADGLMTPFGQTHDVMDAVIAPRVEALAGREPKDPKPFEAREPQIVARTSRFRPTTTKTSYQDDTSLPTADEHQAAVELMGVISDDLRTVRQWRDIPDSDPSADRISGDDGDDELRGGEGDDTIFGDASQDRRERESDSDGASIGEQVRLAERRLAVQARALLNSANGAESQKGLRRRMLMARQSLAEAYHADGMSAAEAADAADLFMIAASPDGLGEAGVTALGFTPVIGEVLSLVEVAGLDRDIKAARAEGNEELISELETTRMLAVLGAVPFVGKVARAGKLIDRVIDGFGPLKQQKIRRRLARARAQRAEDLDPTSARQILGEETWQQLTDGQRKSLHGIFNNRKGKVGEDLVKNWLDQAGLHAPLKGKANLRRYEAIPDEGTTVTRHLDEVTTQHFRKVFGGLWLKRVEGGKGWEVKVDRAKQSANQKKFAEISEGDSTITPKPAEGLEIDLPEIDKQIETLRVPLGDVDEAEFRRIVRKSLEHKEHSAELIEQMDEGIATFFEHYRAAKHRGDDTFAETMTVASIVLAVSASLPVDDEG